MAAAASKAVGRARTAVEQAVALAPRVLGEDGIGLPEKLRLYRMLTPLFHVDAACDMLGVPYVTGATRALPPRFRLGREAPGPTGRARRERVSLRMKGEPFVPASAPLGLLEEGVPKNTLFRREATVRFTLANVSEHRRAALYLPAGTFNPIHQPELFWEVSLNQQVPLVLRYDARTARSEPPRPGLYHSFDPRLLAEGTNELTVRLQQIPGLAAPMGRVPLAHVDVLLWRE
jgi:hypothetical protein